MKNVSRLPFVRSSPQVHVAVEKLPDSQQAPVPVLEKVKEVDLPLVQGALMMTLPLLSAHEAYRITLIKTNR